MTPARTHTRPQSTNRVDISPQHRLPISRAHGKLTGDGTAMGGRMHRGVIAGIVTALLAAGTAQAEPAVPTFVNGLSQAVFATGSANWVNHELWVETTMDTDFDGELDRVHVDVSRPMETETDGLKVPVIYEDSPYYAGGADVTNWAVDHEIGVPPATRPRAPFFTAGNTSPDDQHDLREHLGAARVRRRALRVARHRPLRRLPELRRADRDRGRQGGHRLAQRPRQGLHDAERRRRGRRRLDDRQGRHDRHLLQRHAADRRRLHRRRGARGDRPHLRDLRLVRLLPRQRHGARAGRLPGRGPGRAHRVHLLPRRRDRPSARSAGRRSSRWRPTRTA